METGTHAPALRSANEVPYSPVAFGQQYACLPKLDAILREAQPSAASHRRNLPPITTSGGGEPPGGERRPAFERGAQRNPQLLNRLRRTERNARRGGRRSPSRPTSTQARPPPGEAQGEARRATAFCPQVSAAADPGSWDPGRIQDPRDGCIIPRPGVSLRPASRMATSPGRTYRRRTRRRQEQHLSASNSGRHGYREHRHDTRCRA